jgi:hypothetical protein
MKTIQFDNNTYIVEKITKITKSTHEGNPSFEVHLIGTPPSLHIFETEPLSQSINKDGKELIEKAKQKRDRVYNKFIKYLGKL